MTKPVVPHDSEGARMLRQGERRAYMRGLAELSFPVVRVGRADLIGLLDIADAWQREHGTSLEVTE